MLHASNRGGQKEAHPRVRVGLEVLQKGRRWDWCWFGALFGVMFFAGRCEPWFAISDLDARPV
jgi:hypothetical protein